MRSWPEAIQIHITVMNLRGDSRVSELVSQHIHINSTSTGQEKDGREIFSAVCDLCGLTLRNYRSSKKHIQQRHYQLLRDDNQYSLHAFFGGAEGGQEAETIEHDHESSDVVTPPTPSAIDESVVLLIRLVCRIGLPLCTLNSKHWQDFLQYFGSPMTIKPARLRSLLLIHAEEIKRRNFASLKHKFVTIITDGGTITDREFYIVLMYVEGKIYFAGALHLEKTCHSNIALALNPIVTEIADAGGIPIAIITDNARNLKLATTDRQQPEPHIDTGSQICSVQSLSHKQMLHICCTIHTANLILRDLEKELPGFVTFKRGIKDLFSFLRERKVRAALKAHGVTEKVKLIQEIKWLTYYQAFRYVTKYREQIEAVVRDPPRHVAKRLPDFKAIPEEWCEFLEALSPLGEFIVTIERNETRLCEVFDHLLQLRQKWDDIGGDLSCRLSRLLAARFDNTGDGLLAQVAFLFTPKGLLYFQRIFCVLNEPHEEQPETYARCFRLRDALMLKFEQVYEYFGFPEGRQRVPPLFHQYLTHFTLTAEPMKIQLDRLGGMALTTQTSVIPWRDFCSTAQRLLELPASESVAERVISHMNLLFPSNRYGSKADLVDAQITVRIQEILDDYNKDIGLRTMI